MATSIYGLAEHSPARQIVTRQECGREHALYIALLMLAATNVFVISAAASLLLLVRFN